MSFKDIALPLIQRGLYVFPTSSDGMKIPLIKDWPSAASNQEQAILYWDAVLLRDVNCGVVARGIVVLDDDRGDLAEVILRDTGHELPPTYSVRTSLKKSTGLRGMHYYFGETVETVLSGFHKKAKIFDWQAEHHMVVSAGSRHHSGIVYEEVDPSRQILPCPDWLVHWVETTADAKVATKITGSRPAVHEDFDFDAWCDHHAPIFAIVGHENNYHWADPCPWTDHRHEHSKKTGFYFDGEYLGWADFATGCGGCGKAIGDTIRMLNAKMLELGHEIWREPIWPENPMEALEGYDIKEAYYEPELRYEITVSTPRGRIYSHDGINWYDENDNKI